jgi:hypothetical protein
LIQVEAAKLNGSYLHPAASRLTFNQWADQWWQVWAADPDRSPTTLGAADSRLRCHLRPTFGRRRLSEITAPLIRQWQHELRRMGLEHGTVMACRSLLNRILQAAEDERLIPANPVGKVPPPKRPVDPEVIFGRVQPRVLMPKQLGQLLASARPDDRDVLLVLAGTGLRAGGVCGLRGARVDLGRRRLEVATVRYDAGRFGRGYKPRPKSTAGIRSVPSPTWWSRSCNGAVSPLLGLAVIARLPCSWLTRPPVIRGFALCLPLTEREPLSLRGSRVAEHDRMRVRGRQREPDPACG